MPPLRSSNVYYASGDVSALRPSQLTFVEDATPPRYRTYPADSRDPRKYYADARVYDGEAAPAAVLSSTSVLVEPGRASAAARQVVALLQGGAPDVRVECVQAGDVAKVRLAVDMAAGREEVTREQAELVRYSAAPEPGPTPEPEPAAVEIPFRTLPASLYTVTERLVYGPDDAEAPAEPAPEPEVAATPEPSKPLSRRERKAQKRAEAAPAAAPGPEAGDADGIDEGD